MLRGAALFGVFLMNMVGFASAGVMATPEQLLALPTAALDHTVMELVRWLVMDKANTLFAFLFGLGFYLQMQRLEARGADFERIYRRRLGVLLIFGLLHLFFLWTWDILHLYALAGFALLSLRRASNRTLLWGGLLLALIARTTYKVLSEFSSLETWHGYASTYSNEAALARQQASIAGDYPGLLQLFSHYTLVDYLLNGLMIGWLFYALGRFMLGAWVGRRGWLQNATAHLEGFRRVMRVTLPVGLVLAGLSRLVEIHGGGERLPAWDHWELLSGILHLISVPVLGTGYVCGIVVAFCSQRGRRWLTPFAWSGRMALTNYVMQSFIYAFVLLGIGPGLALAGRIGTTWLLVIVTTAYAAQTCFSYWWLSRFRYGPLEWVWRALTYRQWPRLALA